MEFVQQGTWLRGFEDGEEVASVQLVEDDGVMQVGDLKAEGHFIEMVQKIKELCKGKRIRIFVAYGDDMEKLMHAYNRFGVSPVGVVMEGDF